MTPIDRVVTILRAALPDARVDVADSENYMPRRTETGEYQHTILVHLGDETSEPNTFASTAVSQRVVAEIGLVTAIAPDQLATAREAMIAALLGVILEPDRSGSETLHEEGQLLEFAEGLVWYQDVISYTFERRRTSPATYLP